LKQRILTGVIGGAAFLAILILGGAWFIAVISLLAAIAYYEWINMSKIRMISIPSLIGFMYLATLLFSTLPVGLNKIGFQFNHEYIWMSFVFVLLLFIVFSKNNFSIEQAGALIIGVVYIGFGFVYFIETRIHHELYTILFILLIVWCTDSAAYFIGKRFGKNKLWPSISPNKTVEGSLGGIAVAILAGIIFQLLTDNFDSFIYVMILSLIISAVGQVGDLVESAMKRQYGIKDSGEILPGHGGVLDRFDSLLFVFPVLYVFQLI
jgi:phosphatidate cytidylyltransferase